ncbi:hypothetical protein ACTFIW_003379 [Dictyostelium discoideum]
MKEPSPKLIRWMDLINRFKMEVRHIDGDKNIVADMLSRDSRFEVDWDDKFLDKVRISYKDATGKDLEWLKVMKQRDDVQECNGILYLLDGSTETKRLILINKDQITKVLDEAHSTSYAGHPGVVRLQTKLRASYYFQSFSLKVKKYVQSCAECQKNRIEQEKHGSLHPLPVPIRPWDDVSMDFMNLPNTEKGFDSVYVVVDRLSKMVKIIPCKRTITAIEVAKLFWDNIVCNFGLPLTIVCDNDKLFTAEIWSQMLDEAGVIMKTTVPGRAQADGQTERTNRTIKEMLVKMTQNRLRWDEEMKNVEFAINSSVNTSTQRSPMSIVHGFEPRMPLNINTQYNIQFNEASNYFIQVARDNMVDAQTNQAIQYNKTREDIEYQPGDWVLIKRERLNTIKLNIDDQLKLLPRYCGPFKIVKQSNKLNYQIRIINRMNGNRMIHVDDIKPFIEEDRTLFSKRNKNTHIPLEDEIEKVVNKRCRTYGTGSRIEYLIRYKNSSEDNDTWVPKHYLEEVPQLIKEFEDKLTAAGVRNEDNFLFHNKRVQKLA